MPVDGVSVAQELVLIHIHTSIQDFRQVLEAELSEAEVSVSPVVEEDGQRVTSLVEFGSADNPQVLQGKIIKLVQRHQHVTRHLPDRLEERQVAVAFDTCDFQITHDHFTVLVELAKSFVLLVQIRQRAEFVIGPGTDSALYMHQQIDLGSWPRYRM